MSQNLYTTSQASNGAAPAETSPVQLSLRLRASDRSDRAIVSNVSAVHAGSGMVFVDFGYVEQQSIDEVTRAMRSGQQSAGAIDGRLECRIAMGLGDVVQLARQLQQVVAAAARQHPPASEDLGAAAAGPDASLH